jgi:acyl carrier protein
MRIETETGVDIEPVMFQRFVVLDDVATYLAEKAK